MKKKIIFFTIICVAAFLRFYQLGVNPPSLTWDEAAWGYNAYTLGIDGRDEFGRFLPYDYLESFGDFKPPVYAYLTILPVKVFGLNVFATRFASALFGTLTVFLTYFLTKRIFFSSKYKKEYGVMSSFVLAISPWHIMLSRAAFEANVATFFFVLGIFFFIGGIQEKKWYLPLSAIFIVLSIYTFNTARIVAPVLFIVFAFCFWKKLMVRKMQSAIAVFLGIILILPIAKFLLSPQAALRFKEVNIFSDPEIVTIINQEVANDHNALWSKIIHNRRFVYSLVFIKHYFDNLSPNFLFTKGDGNPKFSIQDVGQMYLWDIPFFFSGIFLLWRKREGYWWIIPVWAFIGIIPAATARETPHALRTEITLPTFQIIAAYGLWNIISRLLNFQMQKIFFIIIFGSLFFNVLYFQHTYFVHYPRLYSGEWGYGYEESIAYARSVAPNYKFIYITQSLGRPYIYSLFFTKYDPRLFRAESIINRDVFGFVHVDGYGKYRFVRELVQKSTSKTLFIDAPLDVPSSANILKKFYLLNGKPVLVAYTM